MAFQPSDKVISAREKYDIARGKAQRAKQTLDATPTSSKNYQATVDAYNAAQEEADSALETYRNLYNEEKTAFESKQELTAKRRKRKTLEAKLKQLEDRRKRALDINQDTTQIDEDIDKTKNDLKSILAGDKKEEEAKGPGRPKGVPADAKFNSVTGQWTLGTQKWDNKGQAIITTPSKKKKPSAVKDADTEGDGVFDPSKVAKANAADIETGFVPITGATIDEIFAKAASVYGGIDEIFKTDPDLRNLLTRAVGKLEDPTDDYTVQRFLSELENTKWFKTNAGPIRQRGFYKRQYDDLVKGLKTDDPNYKQKIAELNRTSEYGRGLQDTEETVREFVTALLGINALDDATIKSIASDIYGYANEGDEVKIRNAVLAAAKYGKGAILGGAAGQNATTLKAIAAANGFDLEKSFGTSLPTWLDNLSKGESIETYKKIIRDAAKTAFNVSDRVSSLLDQGVDLDTIYSPYRNVMASVLELNPQTVTLKDLADKGVISNKDQMNLFDFQRALRKDSRWQFTQNAREEVSNVALNVLRDFGFQG